MFWYSLQLLSETFLILRRNEQDMIKKVLRSSCTLYSWPILINLEFSWQIFEKSKISNFVKIRPVGAKMFHADGRTHMTKLIIAFSQFLRTRLKCNELCRSKDSNRPSKLKFFTYSKHYSNTFRLKSPMVALYIWTATCCTKICNHKLLWLETAILNSM